MNLQSNLPADHKTIPKWHQLQANHLIQHFALYRYRYPLVLCLFWTLLHFTSSCSSFVIHMHNESHTYTWIVKKIKVNRKIYIHKLWSSSSSQLSIMLEVPSFHPCRYCSGIVKKKRQPILNNFSGKKSLRPFSPAFEICIEELWTFCKYVLVEWRVCFWMYVFLDFYISYAHIAWI